MPLPTHPQYQYGQANKLLAAARVMLSSPRIDQELQQYQPIHERSTSVPSRSSINETGLSSVRKRGRRTERRRQRRGRLRPRAVCRSSLAARRLRSSTVHARKPSASGTFPEAGNRRAAEGVRAFCVKQRLSSSAMTTRSCMRSS